MEGKALPSRPTEVALIWLRSGPFGEPPGGEEEQGLGVCRLGAQDSG